LSAGRTSTASFGRLDGGRTWDPLIKVVVSGRRACQHETASLRTTQDVEITGGRCVCCVVWRWRVVGPAALSRHLCRGNMGGGQVIFPATPNFQRGGAPNLEAADWKIFPQRACASIRSIQRQLALLRSIRPDQERSAGGARTASSPAKANRIISRGSASG